MSKAPTHQSLRDSFAETMDDSQGALEHVLALTYEFKDQQLLNLLVGRPLDDNYELRKSDLQRISAIAPVVIYDSRKTGEMNQVPHFMELLPVRMPAFSCHHPKAYLIVRESAIHLILGSMNLTRSGMFSNREVFQHFKWRQKETANLSMLVEFVDLIEQGHEALASASLASVIKTVRQRIEQWSDHGEQSSFLVASGYAGINGLEKLAQLWAMHFPGTKVKSVFAVSPFFDTGQATFATDLRKSFHDFSELRIVTDAANVKGLARHHFGGATACTLNLIADELSNAERLRIQQANDGASVDSMLLRRNLHAKILVLQGQGHALVYMGSANFTRRAWDGTNRELGIAWVLDEESKHFVKRLAEAMNADTVNRYSSLVDVPEKVRDEEDYEEWAAYPEFIERIELVASSEHEVRFEITGENLEQLAAYKITWGNETLAFTYGYSAPLTARTVFARLIGGRNLRFASKVVADAVYYLPFRHSAELFEQRECLLNETAADWITFQIGSQQNSSAMMAGERLPDEGGDGEDLGVSGRISDNRAENASIVMQSYLHLFGQLEAEYRKRADAVLKEPLETRAERWEGMIGRPLTTLVRILQRERQAGVSTQVQHLFKLGELSLMWRTLPAPVGAPALAGLSTPPPANSPLLQMYIDHCLSSYVR
ncbi:MAG: phospholipase D-like domain-containing protein [Pseudomonadota bacterium]